MEQHNRQHLLAEEVDRLLQRAYRGEDLLFEAARLPVDTYPDDEELAAIKAQAMRLARRELGLEPVMAPVELVPEQEVTTRSQPWHYKLIQYELVRKTLWLLLALILLTVMILI